ncbi:MAG: glycoside hydrolase family 92 protein, partial [Jatrophihabitans endophyticus]
MTASPHPGRRAVRLLGVAVLVLSGLLPIADPVAAAGSSPTWVTDPAALVDPLIGTAGAVNDFPGADAPFGMVQWSPDTPSRPKGGGYWYHDDAVTGFSLDHLSGPGCAAAGDVPVLPTSGAVHGSPGAATLPLDHADESATAGEYHLAGGGITTDLTATTRSGMARFSFPAHAPANLLFKLSGSARLASGLRFHVVGPREVEGQVTSGRFCGAGSAYTFYFDMDFDTPFASSGTWTDGDHIRRGATSLHVAGVHSAATTEPSASTADTRSSNGVVRHSPRLHGALPAGDTA